VWCRAHRAGRSRRLKVPGDLYKRDPSEQHQASQSQENSRDCQQEARSLRRDVRDSINLRIVTQVAQVLRCKYTAKLKETRSTVARTALATSDG